MDKLALYSSEIGLQQLSGSMQLMDKKRENDFYVTDKSTTVSIPWE